MSGDNVKSYLHHDEPIYKNKENNTKLFLRSIKEMLQIFGVFLSISTVIGLIMFLINLIHVHWILKCLIIYFIFFCIGVVINYILLKKRDNK